MRESLRGRAELRAAGDRAEPRKGQVGAGGGMVGRAERARWWRATRHHGDDEAGWREADGCGQGGRE